MYEFSGGRGVTVPEATLGHNLGPEFTISTWMKHEAGGIIQQRKWAFRVGK